MIDEGLKCGVGETPRGALMKNQNVECVGATPRGVQLPSS